jgi:murein DD-endopeptidase MepM/ murein hydrolase activator NlpD
LIAGDPEAAINLDLARRRDSLAATVRSIAVPLATPFAEVLGSERKAFAAPPPSRPSGFDAGLIAVGRHRRIVPIGACLLLVAAAAINSLAPVSAAAGAGGGPGSDMGIDSQIASDPSLSPGASAVDIYAGDGTVYNTIQSSDAGAGPDPSPGATAGLGDFQWYAVRGGDGLKKIGARFGISANTLYWANVSRVPDPSAISVGQKLLVPPANGVTVNVKSGNSLSSLAAKYRVSVQAIVTANGLAGTSVTVGQLLVIPVNPVPGIPAPKVAGGGGGGAAAGWHGGKLRWPVLGPWNISQYYNARTHPALDIAASTGQWVVSAYSGTVIYAGWKTTGGGVGGGIVIWISHGGKLYTTYNHLSAEFVKVGQVVSAGQHIGNVGMTGHATGPHLHFEVWVCYPWSTGGTGCARNPLSYLG